MPGEIEVGQPLRQRLDRDRWRSCTGAVSADRGADQVEGLALRVDRDGLLVERADGLGSCAAAGSGLAGSGVRSVVCRMMARRSHKRMTRIIREQGVLAKQGVRTVPLPC